MKNAFTMIELVFVILILGILAVVAIPKLSATRDDAKIASMSQSISIAATEIGSHVIAKGEVENNLSLMSYAIKGLVDSGQATLDEANASVAFKMGKEAECIFMSVTSGTSDANLTVAFGPTADRVCMALQDKFDEQQYPIPLKGQRIAQ